MQAPEKRTERKKSMWYWIAPLFAVVISIILYGILVSKFALTVTHYEIHSDKLTAPIRIVQLTDLHNSQFDDDNLRLITMVRDENPDLIFMTGDMINMSEENTDVAVSLVRELSKIAPVYFSYGNHEKNYCDNMGLANIDSLFEDAGAMVLNDRFIDVLVNDQSLRIGGIYSYCVTVQDGSESEARLAERAVMESFVKSDNCKLLLCHIPTWWKAEDGLNYWDLDVVFAGHDHGGQVILPFIGGLYGHDQGFFPGREWGTFSSQDGKSTLVLSRGLGTAGTIPRFNNVPEIVTVDLLPAE